MSKSAVTASAWTVLTVFAAFMLLIVASGCQSPTGPVIVNNQTVTIGDQPSATASPAPAIASGFDEIRVGIFGHNAECPNPPANTSNTVRAGCAADITATPKLVGNPVPDAVHGPNCTWYLNGQRVDGVASTAVVKVTVQGNPFNLSAQGLSAGSFTLEAEVKGVRSGQRGFSVQ